MNSKKIVTIIAIIYLSPIFFLTLYNNNKNKIKWNI